MPVTDEPFRSFGGGIAKPYLAVKYINPHTGKDFISWAMIDTGADECALPASMAPILGHDLMRGSEKRISTGNGITAAYAHAMQIKIAGFCTEETLIDFMPGLHVPLIGVKSFLSHFVLTVNYPKQIFSIKK